MRRIKTLKYEENTSSCNIATKENLPLFSRSVEDWKKVLISFLFFILAYIVFSWIDLQRFFVGSVENLSNLSFVIIFGVSAGLSTCMGLIGGLVLGISTKYLENNPSANLLERFRPHLYFNLGRIIFFFIFGYIIGLVGFLIQPSLGIITFITILLSIYMIFLGLQNLGVFPILSKYTIIFPKSISKYLDLRKKASSDYSNFTSFILGGLSFFLPCSFTQAIQLYALSTGNPILSGMMLSVFALGTSLGLISLGGFTSFINNNFRDYLFKFSGFLVILFGVINLQNSLNLTNVKSSSVTNNTSSKNNYTVPVINGYQIVKMNQSYKGYYPNKFVIKKGIPVKWVIESSDINNCSASIFSQELNINKLLVKGENNFEFTPTENGIIKFSCSMGMYPGYFEVVD